MIVRLLWVNGQKVGYNLLKAFPVIALVEMKGFE
jgi:hypothetical protein